MSREVVVRLPDWVDRLVAWDEPCPTAEARVALAVRLAEANVVHKTGGPFGAAVFDNSAGTPVAVGVNLVASARNSVLHAETVALMLAQAALGRYSLGGDDPSHVLAASCEPCAMCLGAVHWSGVRTVEWGASREDAERVGFEEGPVFAQSYAYLERRGMRFTRGVLRERAVAVLEAYRDGGGVIYNG